MSSKQRAGQSVPYGSIAKAARAAVTREGVRVAEGAFARVEVAAELRAVIARSRRP